MKLVLRPNSQVQEKKKIKKLCTTSFRAEGLFGSRPSRQLAGQAAISAPGDENRTPGSAAWPGSFAEAQTKQPPNSLLSQVKGN